MFSISIGQTKTVKVRFRKADGSRHELFSIPVLTEMRGIPLKPPPPLPPAAPDDPPPPPPPTEGKLIIVPVGAPTLADAAYFWKIKLPQYAVLGADLVLEVLSQGDAEVDRNKLIRHMFGTIVAANDTHVDMEVN